MDFKKMRESAVSDMKNLAEYENSNDPAKRKKAAEIKGIMKMLPDRERDILEQFYSKRTERYAGHRARLCTKYDISMPVLYRAKEDAVMQYCLCATAYAMAAKKA